MGKSLLTKNLEKQGYCFTATEKELLYEFVV